MASVRVALGMLSLTGCTNYITMKDGAVVEGCIKCADVETLYVGGDHGGSTCPNYGCEPVRVPHDDIDEISYAGKGVVILGAAMIVAGALLSTAAVVFAVAPPEGDTEWLEPELSSWLAGGFGFGLAAGGSVVVSFGVRTWTQTREAAQWSAGNCQRVQPPIKEPR